MQSPESWSSSLDAPARGALKRARDESERAQLPYIGTEQLLLGLLGQPRGVAGRVLRSFGLELESVRAAFGQWRPTAHEHAAAVAEQRSLQDLQLTSEAKSAISRAVDGARGSGTHSIGTEHLLQGILDADAGSAVEFLRARGIDLPALRARTVQVALLGSRTPRRGPRGYGPPAQMHVVERPDWEAPSSGVRSNVVMCRLDDAQLEAIDILIEAGVRANRSDAAAWLIRVGLESKAGVVDAVREKVAEIRRIREDAKTLAEDADTST
jgi:ATP-dependent Clp protease ATP-binding subunit ClpA